MHSRDLTVEQIAELARVFLSIESNTSKLSAACFRRIAANDPLRHAVEHADEAVVKVNAILRELGRDAWIACEHQPPPEQPPPRFDRLPYDSHWPSFAHKR